MKNAFHIYPALFVLIAVEVEEAIQGQGQLNEEQLNTDADQYFTSCPQTYWGNCLMNGDQKQILFGFSEEKKDCPVQSMLGGRLNILEPKKFNGKRYTITYIPVLN